MYKQYKQDIILVWLAIGLLFLGYIQLTNIQQDTRKDTVYAVCNQSRVSVEITEQECATLQDKWNMEFMCTQANRDPFNVCWVEVK